MVLYLLVELLVYIRDTVGLCVAVHVGDGIQCVGDVVGVFMLEILLIYVLQYLLMMVVCFGDTVVVCVEDTVGLVLQYDVEFAAVVAISVGDGIVFVGDIVGVCVGDAVGVCVGDTVD